jgi:hypothetical protein
MTGWAAQNDGGVGPRMTEECLNGIDPSANVHRDLTVVGDDATRHEVKQTWASFIA